MKLQNDFVLGALSVFEGSCKKTVYKYEQGTRRVNQNHNFKCIEGERLKNFFPNLQFCYLRQKKKYNGESNALNPLSYYLNFLLIFICNILDVSDKYSWGMKIMVTRMFF